MKYIVLFVALPIVFALEIKSNSLCIDGTLCPQGTYCCKQPNGKHKCCDLPDDVKSNSHVQGAPASSSNNISIAGPMNAYCPGTQCGNYCIPNVKWGVCCALPGKACPSGTICCSTYSQAWCCKKKDNCGSTVNSCLSNDTCVRLGIACPYGTKCCTNSLGQAWCCGKRDRCGAALNVCINGAVSLSTTMLSVCFAFLTAMIAKYSL